MLVQPAISPAQVIPQTKRNVALGLVLGLLWGVGLAFLIERLDTRVRTSEQVETLIDLPVLGELPKPPQSSIRGRRVTMIDQPFGSYAESVRKLRAQLEFANLGADLRTLMVTSAVQGEGKSTVAADLAVAFARFGKRVVLCDLDARSPSVDHAFGLEVRRGLVDVATGRDSLDRALVLISWAGIPGRMPVARSTFARTPAEGPAETLGQAGEAEERPGRLDILTLGSRRPHDPADFVGSSPVRQVIESLAETHDIVIVDTAPPPSGERRVADQRVRGCSADRLRPCDCPEAAPAHGRRSAAAFPTRIVGVAVTGTAPIAGYGYAPDENAADGRV